MADGDESGFSMTDQIFADALGGILVTAGTVRLDFVAISPTSTDGGPAKLELQQRIIMPVESFLRAAAKMQEAVQALSRQQQGAVAPPNSAAPRPEDGKVPFP